MNGRKGADGLRSLATLSILYLIAGCSGNSTPEPYTDEQGNYRILTVGTAKHSQRKVPTPAGELTMFATENRDGGGTSRTVIYTDYPAQLVHSASADTMLDGGVRGIVVGGQWNLESQKPIVVDGHPGREVQFSVSASGGREKGAGKARFFLVGERFYQTIIVGPASKVTMGDMDDFLNSFELMRKVAVAARSSPSPSSASELPRVAQAQASAPPAAARPIDRPSPPSASEEKPGEPAPPDPVRPAEPAQPDIRPAPASNIQPSGPPGPNRIQRDDSGSSPAKAGDVAVGAKAVPAFVYLPEPNGDMLDRFRDVPNEGGVLVGAAVGYINAFGGNKIGMIQPIFQGKRSLINGRRHGRNIPTMVRVVARPGYAVGAINTRTGLLLDAFQLVFMKLKNGRLDPDDSYTSNWLGDPRGGGSGSASSDGRPVIGIHGRTNGREVNMLGLVVTD
jgi:hypothetical protein